MKTSLLIALLMTSLLLNSDCSARLNKRDLQLESREVLLSYPRSGRTLTRNLIQILTRKPVRRAGELVTKSKLGFDLDQKKVPLWPEHDSKFLPKLDPNTSKLLIIIRNYKECIVRHEKQETGSDFTASQLRNCILNNHDQIRQYIGNLMYYDTWPNDETKLLIFYEDLIKQPEVEIPKIMDLLGENDVDLDSFFANYEDWTAKILNVYKKNQGTQYSSSGNKDIYHSKNFPVNILQEIDQSIENSYPELWEKYLKRYQTVPSTPNSNLLF